MKARVWLPASLAAAAVLGGVPPGRLRLIDRHEASDRVQPALHRAGLDCWDVRRFRRGQGLRHVARHAHRADASRESGRRPADRQADVHRSEGLDHDDVQRLAGPLDDVHQTGKGTFEIVGGTGAYAGIKGQGTFLIVVDASTNQLIGMEDGQAN